MDAALESKHQYKRRKERELDMSTSPARPNHHGMPLDIVILVLFVVVAVAGIVSIVFNSINGLAFTQLALTLGGLLLGLLQVWPGLFGTWLKNMVGHMVNVLRVVTVLLLIAIVVLQVITFLGHSPSPIATVQPSPTSTVQLSPTPTPNPVPTNFSFTTITLKNRQVLQNQQPVTIPVAELPLTITGTYSSQGSGQVWVVVEDLYGQYYLQTPPVRFADGGIDGQWRASNVDTNVGTTRIDFVYVTPQGNDTYQHRMDAKDFCSFTQLPNGYKLLLTINIVVNG